jgi:aspartate racemase
MAGDERILGIVGGVGPESTIDYYRSLIATWRRRRPDGSYPRVVIDSIEGGRTIRALGERDFDLVGGVLGFAIARLAAAGCGRALIASNATHLAFDRIHPPPRIPLLHIVETARDAALLRGHRRLGLIGTTFVMRSPLYPDRFEQAGIDIIVPPVDDQEIVHEIYMGELLVGEIRDASRERVLAIAERMRVRDGIDGLILGGTELALILTEPAYGDMPILNTTRIHVDAAVDWLLTATEDSGQMP